MGNRMRRIDSHRLRLPIIEHRKCPKYGSHVALSQHLLHFLSNYPLKFTEQEAFEKCWAHSPLRAAARRLFYIAIHQVSLLSHAATVARRLRIDVHNVNVNDNNDNNDNA